MKIGNKIIHLDSVDSTSNYIANLMKLNEVENGTVILADDQFGGRGQRGSEWVVKPGENLTFSFLLSDVNLSVNHQFFLTELVSLSLVDLLRKYGLKAEVKWPNDIYLNGVKIAGVLIENQLSHSTIKNTIIGIGLNVNQSSFDGFNATSIQLETGQFRNVNDVLFGFIESFNRISEKYPTNHFDSIHANYSSNLYLLHQKSSFSDKDGEFIGEIVNVLQTGQLILRKESGVEVEYNLKEIKFLK